MALVVTLLPRSGVSSRVSFRQLTDEAKGGHQCGDKDDAPHRRLEAGVHASDARRMAETAVTGECEHEARRDGQDALSSKNHRDEVEHHEAGGLGSA